jgi:purine-binding chemotaxis protein CheW
MNNHLSSNHQPAEILTEIRRRGEPTFGEESSFHPLEEIVAQIDSSVSLTQAEQVPAKTADQTATKTRQEKYFIFSLSGGSYAVPISHMQEVGTILRTTPLPGTPVWLKGLSSLRGTIISIVDCGAYFHLQRNVSLNDCRLCVVSTKGNDVTTGLIVDRIEGMLYCDESQIRAPGEFVQDRVSPWLNGVYEHEGRLVNMLNVERLLHSLDSIF